MISKGCHRTGKLLNQISRARAPIQGCLVAALLSHHVVVVMFITYTDVM
jgi:hypothetical protein